ncbi:MAG: short-chain dehydrogenase, partial [Verrucomicrobiota bacterium]
MQGGFIQPSITTIREAIEAKFFTNLKIARLAVPKIIEGGSMTFTAGSGGRPQNASGAIIGNMNIRVMVEGLAFELAPKIRVN